MLTFLFWAGVIILGLTWVAYPAAIGLLSLFFPRTRTDPSCKPSISVILATREPANVIRCRVENILETSYPRDRIQIVVAVDAAAHREVPDLSDVAPDVPLTVVRGHEPGGKALTLNAAGESASGEILVFTDARQRFGPETLPELVAAFAEEKVGGASGHLVLPRRPTGPSAVDLYWSLERWLRARETRIHSPVGVTGAAWALRARIWTPLPAGLILDDVYTPLKAIMAGYRVAHVEAAPVYETRIPKPADEHLRKTRTLTGVLQLCAWLPEILMPWKNPISLQFVIHKLFRLLTPVGLFLILSGGGWLLWTEARALALLLLGVLAVLSAWLAVGWPAAGRRIRTLIRELALTQISVLKAVLNALRGRWEVWDQGEPPG